LRDLRLPDRFLQVRECFLTPYLQGDIRLRPGLFLQLILVPAARDLARILLEGDNLPYRTQEASRFLPGLRLGVPSFFNPCKGFRDFF
jgi:hypothetical protein